MKIRPQIFSLRIGSVYTLPVVYNINAILSYVWWNFDMLYHIFGFVNKRSTNVLFPFTKKQKYLARMWFPDFT